MTQKDVDIAIDQAFKQYDWETDKEGAIDRHIKEFKDEYGDSFEVFYDRENGVFWHWKKYKFVDPQPINWGECEVMTIKPLNKIKYETTKEKIKVP